MPKMYVHTIAKKVIQKDLNSYVGKDGYQKLKDKFADNENIVVTTDILKDSQFTYVLTIFNRHSNQPINIYARKNYTITGSDEGEKQNYS